MRKPSWWWKLAVGLLALPLLILSIAWLRVAFDDDRPSQSIGRLSSGHLVHGHVLPPWGRGYRTYSFLGAALGRQYVHGRVRDTLLAAFADRAEAGAVVPYVVGESATRKGGKFHGHRTHQTGLSVDLFMPVRDARGTQTVLPTWPWQGLGYWHHFDETGAAPSYAVDFEELALLLTAIDRQATAHGISIERVIVAPEYVPRILATPAGQKLGTIAGKLTRKPVWVRHDEHVHLDFVVPER